MATAATITTTATDTKISLRIRNRQQKKICRCGTCRKKLKFSGISEYPLTCWNCMKKDKDLEEEEFFRD
jgi:hypothetical protein